ncbi:MAG: rplW [Parcubacteria group bacterium]|nr:rplW [Parcubacteria group bacterium]
MTQIHIKPATVLLRPRITEKAALKADKDRVYVFEVTEDATHRSVIASIKDAYKVTPIKVRLLAIPTKKVFRGGKRGVKGGGKKAYVYLKKDDKIDVI